MEARDAGGIEAELRARDSAARARASGLRAAAAALGMSQCLAATSVAAIAHAATGAVLVTTEGLAGATREAMDDLDDAAIGLVRAASRRLVRRWTRPIPSYLTPSAARI